MPQATPLLLLLERLTRAVEALAQGRHQQRVPLSQAPQETSQETPQSSRGAMRQRILTLLREHPEQTPPRHPLRQCIIKLTGYSREISSLGSSPVLLYARPMYYIV
jgi:hypothetical protein